tara:strand:+ start:3696 stop:4091 length:396 start_codon:yes stop_codon:yes gene_type:complete
VETIVEDARRVREKDDTPIANFPKGLSKIFEEETDVHEYEKYHPRIKGERLSIILKKPNSFDWASFFSKTPKKSPSYFFYFLGKIQEAERRICSRLCYAGNPKGKHKHVLRGTKEFRKKAGFQNALCSNGD